MTQYPQQHYSETPMKIEIDNSIPVVEFSRALASGGFQLENDGQGGLRVTKPSKCPACYGTGWDWQNNILDDCLVCGGAGVSA